MIKIISDIGYCQGVRGAIELMKESGKTHSHLYLTHPLIHNIPENESLMKENNASLFTEETILNKGDAILLSAHGHTIEEEEKFKRRTEIIDATCPLIQTRYRSIQKEKETNYIYLGKKNHQETLGFLSNFPYFIFISQEEDLKERFSQIHFEKNTVLIPQTTLSADKRNEAIALLESLHLHYKAYPICPSYGKRIKDCINATKDLSPEGNFFLVVGDPMSSNANELYSAIKKNNPQLEGYLGLSLNEELMKKTQGRNLYITSATSVNETTVMELIEHING